MSRALLFVYLETHFIECARVADLLKRERGWSAVFLFAYRYPASARDVEWCRQSGFQCIDQSGEWIVGGPFVDPSASVIEPKVSLADRRRTGLGAWLLNRLPQRSRDRVRAILMSFRTPGRVENLLVPMFPRLAIYMPHYRAQRELAARILDVVMPDLLILPEDNVEYTTGLLVREARERSIPSAIVPYTIVNAEEIAEAYWHNPTYCVSGWRDRLVRLLFPKWFHRHRGRDLMRLPVDNIIALELSGLAPPLPWIVNSGFADAIAVEGPFMRDYYIAAGLPPEKLVVTGALYDDVLHEHLLRGRERAAELRASLGLQAEGPVLLCALPPDQYPSGRPGAEFANYEKMLRAWADVLREAKEYQVLIRLHPRTSKQDVGFLEKEFGLRVVEQDTATLIPLCDVYVASVSATIRLAVAAGKPVLNYDCYRFRYSDFRCVPGVVTVEDVKSFRTKIELLADPEERRRLAETQRQFAARANIIDGHAGERMLNLFDHLALRCGRQTR